MKPNLALTLVLSFALFAKALIPTGWMPTGGKAFEITVCTGTDTHKMWLDVAGTLHKQDPSKPNNADLKDKPCAFAGLSAAHDLPPATDALQFVPDTFAPIEPRPALVAIGRGLAAPPPPATGPPALV